MDELEQRLADQLASLLGRCAGCVTLSSGYWLWSVYYAVRA